MKSLGAMFGMKMELKPLCLVSLFQLRSGFRKIGRCSDANDGFDDEIS